MSLDKLEDKLKFQTIMLEAVMVEFAISISKITGEEVSDILKRVHKRADVIVDDLFDE